jgi:large subunit ribosomal protein L29
MKASDLREKGVEDLRELHKSLARDVFQNRLKNFTNRLDDTSTMRKTKRDLARVATLLRESEMGIVRSPAAGPEAKGAPVEPAERKPAVKATKAAAGAKIAPKKSAAKKADAPKKSKKSEAK